jgi:hypothetical protein
MKASNIHTGTWTNYSRGRLYGVTLTLTDDQAIALISFLAVLITHTGSRSFKILRFILHQTRSHEAPRDGLVRQQEVLLRNSETDMGTLPLIPWIAFKWRGHTPRPYRRSLPLFVMILVHTLGFMAASIATSFVANAEDAPVLAKGTECGEWTFGEDKSVTAVSVWHSRKQTGTVAARGYTQMCYDGAEDDEVGGNTQLECRMFPTRRLKWKGFHNVSCPFNDGICLEGANAAYMMDTELQSSRALGINSQYELQWQHRTICAPLRTDGYIDVRQDGVFGEKVTYYNYGAVGSVGNWSHRVSELERAGGSKGFVLNVQTSAPWIGNNIFQLQPIPELDRNDSDVTLFFIGAYGVNYFARKYTFLTHLLL